MDKEKVIYIETDEEITGVISRVKKVKNPKVVLVIPKGSIILGSIVNLKMLKKHEKSLGKEIIIATTDRTGRHLASQVGFVAVHSLDDKALETEPEPPKDISGPKVEFAKDKEPQKEAEKDSGPEITFKEIKDEEKPLLKPKEEAAKEPPKKKKGLSKLAKKILLGFGILGFMAGVLTVLFVLPKAVITVFPRADELRQEVNLAVKGEPKEASDIKGDLTEVTQEGSKSYPATGKKNVGEKAKGNITVYNEWDSNAQGLVAGTRFIASDGKTFRTTQAVNVPGTTIQSGKIVAGAASVGIEADQPGEAYNIGAASFTIPGLPADKQAKIYGKSSSAMSGGFTKEIKVVSKKDVEDAKVNLGEELGVKAKDEISKKAQGKKVLDAALKEDLLEEKLSVNEGQEAGEFSLTVKKNVWTFAFNEDDAKERISQKIKETLSGDKELVQGKLENIEYKAVDETKENGLSLSISATAFATKKLELSKSKTDIPRKNKEEVTQYFKQNEEIVDVKVDFWPFWVSKVPLNRSRIEIKVNPAPNK